MMQNNPQASSPHNSGVVCYTAGAPPVPFPSSTQPSYNQVNYPLYGARKPIFTYPIPIHQHQHCVLLQPRSEPSVPLQQEWATDSDTVIIPSYPQPRSTYDYYPPASGPLIRNTVEHR